MFVSRKQKLWCLLITVACLCGVYIFCYLSLKPYIFPKLLRNMNNTIAEHTPRTASRYEALIHLDLKGAPPKLSYFKEVFPLFRQWGATGLLVEYEDMFPYSGNLSVLPRNYSYTKQDIQDIQALAKTNQLDFIPLIQTFGHMEFVLKHDKFAHLREVRESAFCISAGPCVVESYTVIKEMITQLMAAHPKVTHLHIGSDEVVQLGKGQACVDLMRKTGTTREKLFLQHVTHIAGFVKKTFPGVTPIIWDDMLRATNDSILQAYNVGGLIEPMVWRYEQDVEKRMHHAFWTKYGQLFKKVWVASAFKGATSVQALVPNIQKYVNNNFQWRNTIEREKRVVNIRGIALTGWSRYEHFLGMCELLPVSLPSVACCLQTFVNGGMSKEAAIDMSQKLGCQNEPITDTRPKTFTLETLHNCSFPGFDLYNAVHRVHRLTHARRQSSATPVQQIKEKIQALKTSLRITLAKYYYPDTVDEWINQNFMDGPYT